MKRVHLLVRGRVQGVFYRQSTLEIAASLGLCGWVRNLRSGDVEVVAEGAEERLEALVDWCRRGPPSARVDSLEALWATGTGEFTDFRVRF